IVGRHHGDENRFLRNRISKLLYVYEPMPIHRKISHLIPMLLQGLAAVQDRFVFGYTSYDMVALVAVRLSDALDSQVVGLRRTAGEDNLPRRGGVDQSRDLLSRMVYSRFALPPEGMIPARCIAELFREVWKHGFQYSRIHRSGCVIVHVNRNLHVSPYPTDLV